MIYVLDACAMIALLGGEAGADVVENALLEAGSECVAHSINLCEVYYVVWRKGGEVAAEGAVDDLKAAGVVERSDFDEAFWREVGKLKAVQVKVSLADCCAVTLTNRLGGVLLTSDHHELDPVAAAGLCNITFIR
jgi:PIN domain nuclease of toxin-antitoxin system